MIKLYSLTKAQRVVNKDRHQPSVLSHKAKSLVMILRENHMDMARLNVIVPKKHVALAVNRNRIKRWVKEQFRLRQETFKGLDLVVISRYSSGRLKFHHCKQSFDDLIASYQKPS